MDDIEDIKRRNAERAAAQRGECMRPSALPHDPSLPSDAQALRAKYETPLERLAAHGAGIDVYDGDMTRMAADKITVAYLNRAPAARQEVTIDSAEQVKLYSNAILDIMRSGHATPEQVAAMRDAYAGKH